MISQSSLDRPMGELTRLSGRLHDITENSRVEHAMPFELKRPDHRPAPVDVLRFKLALPSPKYTSFLFCSVGAWVPERWMTHSTRNMDVDVQAR